MKRKCWIFAMMLALLPFGQACQHAERDEPPAPTRPAQPGAGGPQLSQEPYLTLAQIDACPYTDLVPVPAGYVLARAGIWSYSAAYLLIHKATGRRIGEVYENCLVNGAEECNLDWQSTDFELCCDDGGSNCTSEYSHDGIFMLVKC